MKKILKVGCLSIIGLFVISAILTGIFGSNSEVETDTEKPETKAIVLDSTEIKKQQKQRDSLRVLTKKKREKAKRALKNFKKNKDDFEGNAFYRDPRTPYYTNVNFIYPYIGQEGESYWLRLKFQYASNDWLFINKGVLLIDGEKFTINGNWKRDNNSGIWEWLDIPVRKTELMILEKIANSKSAKIRYIGTKYHNDRTITRKEKNIIKKTLGIYNDLK